MARYRYRLRDADGRSRTGVMEAASAEAVADQLADSGGVPLEIEAAPAAALDIGALWRKLSDRRPETSDLLLFARQAHALTRAGVPIARGFTQLAHSTRNPRLAAAIAAIVEDLESGRELAGSMARHTDVFSPLFIAMMRVGEESGRLDEAFGRMAAYLEHERETANQVRSALRYPTFVVVAIAVAIFILMAYVIPVFARVYSGFDLELPLPTRILIALSNFVAAYWWLLLGLTAAAVVGVRRYVATDAGRLLWDRAKLRLPIIGSILQRATLSRFARAFGMASRSGVPFLQGLGVSARAVDNAFISGRILEMRSGVERGESLVRTAVHADIFTPLVIQMLGVGEETGQVDTMLEEVAVFYEDEVSYDVRRLADLIQPILTAGIGVIVFILALGVFLPMWDLTKLAGP